MTIPKKRRLIVRNGETLMRGWSGRLSTATPLALVRDAALEQGTEPVCRYCRHFLGDWCKLTDATQIPDGVCLSMAPAVDSAGNSAYSG